MKRFAILLGSILAISQPIFAQQTSSEAFNSEQSKLIDRLERLTKDLPFDPTNPQQSLDDLERKIQESKEFSTDPGVQPGGYVGGGIGDCRSTDECFGGMDNVYVCKKSDAESIKKMVDAFDTNHKAFDWSALDSAGLQNCVVVGGRFNGKIDKESKISGRVDAFVKPSATSETETSIYQRSDSYAGY